MWGVFYALIRLTTYLRSRSTMTEKRLNNCFLAKLQLTDEINLADVTKEFIVSNDERWNHFAHLQSDLCILSAQVLQI